MFAKPFVENHLQVVVYLPVLDLALDVEAYLLIVAAVY